MTATSRDLTGILLAISLAACSPRVFTQSSGSMEPTIPRGSTFAADFSAYESNTPARWDVVIFDSPDKSRWASRIVGLPGEIIDFAPTTGLMINGKPLAMPSHLSAISYKSATGTTSAFPGYTAPHFPYTLPADTYFVLGDNVSTACDSRYWGGLPLASIHGKALGK